MSSGPPGQAKSTLCQLWLGELGKARNLTSIPLPLLFTHQFIECLLCARPWSGREDIRDGRSYFKRTGS